MKKSSLVEWMKLGLVLLGLAYAVFDIIIVWRGDEHVVEAVFRIAMVTAVLFFFDMTVSAARRSRGDLRWRDAFYRANRKTIAKKVLERFEQDVNEGPHDEERMLVMEPGWLAKQSYELFWECLIERNQHRPGHPLSVITVHTTPIEVWNEHPRLISLQHTFLEQKGTISRVICGARPQPSALEKQVIQRMKDVGVSVRYYYRDKLHDPFGYDFSWDFAFVRKDADVCIWDTLRGDGDIQRALLFKGRSYKKVPDLELLFEELCKLAPLVEDANHGHSDAAK